MGYKHALLSSSFFFMLAALRVPHPNEVANEHLFMCSETSPFLLRPLASLHYQTLHSGRAGCRSSAHCLRASHHILSLPFPD